MLAKMGKTFSRSFSGGASKFNRCKPGPPGPLLQPGFATYQHRQLSSGFPLCCFLPGEDGKPGRIAIPRGLGSDGPLMQKEEFIATLSGMTSQRKRAGGGGFLLSSATILESVSSVQKPLERKEKKNNKLDCCNIE